MELNPTSADRPAPGGAVAQDSDGLFPWRWFVRALGCTFRLRVLLLAGTGVVVASLISSATDRDAGTFASGLASAAGGPFGAALGPLRWWAQVVDQVGRPWFDASPNWLVGRLLSVATVVWWALLGGAVARVAARLLTHREPPTPPAAMAGSARGMVCRCAPIAGVAIVCWLLLLPLWLHGWLMGVPVLDFLSALLLPIPIALAVAAAALLVLLAINWPLLIACPAVERTDPFDATSRAYAYVTQRPVRLAAYVLTAIVVAAPVGLVVAAGSQLVAGWVAGSLPPVVEAPTVADRIGRLWIDHLVEQLPSVFYAAYTWCAAAATYLLLRRDVDGVQVDDLEG